MIHLRESILNIGQVINIQGDVEKYAEYAKMINDSLDEFKEYCKKNWSKPALHNDEDFHATSSSSYPEADIKKYFPHTHRIEEYHCKGLEEKDMVKVKDAFVKILHKHGFKKITGTLPIVRMPSNKSGNTKIAYIQSDYLPASAESIRNQQTLVTIYSDKSLTGMTWSIITVYYM